MNVKIITPSKVLCEEDNITKLKAPGICGDFGIWNNHASFVTVLGDGIVSFTKEENEEKKEFSFKVKDGFFGVMNNKITILADEGQKLE